MVKGCPEFAPNFFLEIFPYRHISGYQWSELNLGSHGRSSMLLPQMIDGYGIAILLWFFYNIILAISSHLNICTSSQTSLLSI